MGTTCSRPLPPLPPLPNFPAPPPLHSDPHKFQSKLPPPRPITPPPLPPSLAIPPHPVPLVLSHHLVPKCFGEVSALLPYPDHPNSSYHDSNFDSDDANSSIHAHLPCGQLGFTDNPQHRFLFHQAILGFTASTSAATISLLGSSPHADIEKDAQRFEQTLVSLNLYAISLFLRKVPGFILRLHPSCYFGYAGLEVWVEWFDGSKFWSVYLYGIEEVTRDVVNICRLVEGVNIGGGWRKCWGVLGANETVNEGIMGEAMSRLIAEVWRRRPRRGGPFLVPDSLAGTRPPLFPHEVFSMDTAAFEQLSQQWALGEQVRKEWIQGKETWVAGNVTTDGGALSRCLFEGEWDKVQECDELKRVIGAVASGFLNSEREECWAITSVENGKAGVEVVLQTRQFCKLREVLCAVGKE